MKPIPFNALAKRLNLHHDSQTLVRGVAIDSRKVESNDLFFALPGNRVDGHAFLAEVARKEAAGAVVHESYQGESFGLPLLKVPDVLGALQELARKSLEKRSSKVIAISGSLGKTTVKSFAATLLRSCYRVYATPLSYNSQATIPLCILLADETEDYLILEMGMTHPGELANLVSIAPPDIALITTIAVQHAVNFPDGLEGIAKEKASLFSHPKTQVGLFHYDIEHYEQVYNTGTCSKRCFSTLSKEADFYHDENGRIHVKGEGHFDLPVDLPVKAHYHNFLAAVALARAVDIPWPLIREAAQSIRLPAMRFERVEKRGIIFINDAYNANPDSMKAALESLPKPIEGGKTIAVLSEMDALGDYTEAAHAAVAETALTHADFLLCVGPRCQTMQTIWQQANKPVERFETRDNLEQSLLDLAKPGDVVLLKGARSYALDQILNKF